MKPPSLPLFLFLLLSTTISAAPSLSPTPSPTKSPIPPLHKPTTTSSSPLDPKQLKALKSLNIPTVKNPCDNHRHSAAVVTCDAGSPFRFVTSITFTNCSTDLSLSTTALKSLSPSLTSLSFTNCPSLSPPPHLPESLHSFSTVSSFKHLTGVSSPLESHIHRFIKQSHQRNNPNFDYSTLKSQIVKSLFEFNLR